MMQMILLENSDVVLDAILLFIKKNEINFFGKR